jgi:hypothetical protein
MIAITDLIAYFSVTFLIGNSQSFGASIFLFMILAPALLLIEGIYLYFYTYGQLSKLEITYWKKLFFFVFFFQLAPVLLRLVYTLFTQQRVATTLTYEFANQILATQFYVNFAVLIPWSLLWATIAYFIFSRSEKKPTPQQPEPQIPPPSLTTHM